MMFNSVTISIAVIIALVQANPARVRRDDRVERYCQKHEEHYNKYCNNKEEDLDRNTFAKLAKFCPAYEKHCAVGKAGAVDLPDFGTPLVMPPSLPKGSDFAMMDLPIGEEAKSHQISTQSATRLTAAIIASCTPECNAAHCTDECKCAHTHPKVHQMCNPPSSAAMAETCQKWYAKCTMFAPVQY